MLQHRMSALPASLAAAADPQAALNVRIKGPLANVSPRGGFGFDIRFKGQPLGIANVNPLHCDGVKRGEKEPVVIGIIGRGPVDIKLAEPDKPPIREV